MRYLNNHYIRSINESNLDKVIYIKHCFIDIYEDERLDVTWNIHNSGNKFMISIKVNNDFYKVKTSGNPYIGVGDTSINELLKYNSDLNMLYNELKISIERVILEYDINYTLKSNKTGTIIHINFDIN